MDYRLLGQSGLKVSSVGLGCNNFGMIIDAAATKAVVHKALDLGITLFDTADQYGNGASEEYLGTALGKRRNEVIVATKFGNPMGDTLSQEGGASRAYIMHAVEASLKRLKTDYIDLYQIHRPDPETPLDETLRALDDLVHQGKIRYFGHSNFSGWQTADAAWICDTHGLSPPISAQHRYSVLSRTAEAEILPSCAYFGAGFLPYFPLESGLLTGKYQSKDKPPTGSRWAAWSKKSSPMVNRFFGDDRQQLAAQLSSLCSEHGNTMLELAFGWLLDNPVVSSVIAGATKPTQIKDNVKASTWRPSDDMKAAVDTISPPPPPPLPPPRQR